MIGTTIDGKYEVRSVLGEGGMGTVFEAEHRGLGRIVAIKVLHPAKATRPAAVKRFQQEARAAGTIGHPNICEVYDIGTLDDGRPYLVMERLVGETVAERITREGGLPLLDVIDILSEVLSALTAAHEKGIVHRDIKPENVFLSRRPGELPVAKLLDFGISKATFSGTGSDELALTRTGFVVGTPFYMSPEQARGDRDLDARVDVYGCGVLMYEMVTGKRPFDATNYNALLAKIGSVEPTPARDLREMPPGFDLVIQKAMQRDRDERYLTAIEFQRDLEQLDDAPTSKLGRHPFGRRPAPGVAPVLPVSAGVRASKRARSAAPLTGTTTATAIPVVTTEDLPEPSDPQDAVDPDEAATEIQEPLHLRDPD